MATPYFNYAVGKKSDNDDGAGQYATATKQMLVFTDARNPNNAVSFIAFLGSFSQSFTSNWNQEEVIGRMDSLATFKNTTRMLSVEWTVPAGNAAVAMENLNRCNRLIALLYPTYTKSGATVMSKPPLIRLQYSNLIQKQDGTGLLGYITSLNWAPVIEQGSYHQGGDIFPKAITLSIEFHVLHESTESRGGPTGYFPSGESLDTGNDFTKKAGVGSKSSGKIGQPNAWPFGINWEEGGDGDE